MPNNFEEILKTLQAEHICDSAQKKHYIICAKPLTAAEKKALIKVAHIPEEEEILFRVGPKMTTMNTLPLIILQKGLIPFKMTQENQWLSLHILQDLTIEHLADIIPIMVPLIKQDGYYKGFSIWSFEKQVAYIDFSITAIIKENHKRDLPITSDDITDIKILLGESNDIDSFLNNI
jgi:hypothetical protein